MSDQGKQGNQENQGDQKEGQSALAVARELTRLLHDVADAQMRVAELVSAFWRDLSELTEACEGAAREIHAAAKKMEAITGIAKGEGSHQGSERGESGPAAASRERAGRRRTIRTYSSYGRGGREQTEPAASGQGDDALRQGDPSQLAADLERLVADAQKLVELLNQREA